MPSRKRLAVYGYTITNIPEILTFASTKSKPVVKARQPEIMRALALLFALQFLHAEMLQESSDGADSSLWDLSTGSGEAGTPLFSIDSGDYTSPDSVVLDDSNFLQSSASVDPLTDIFLAESAGDDPAAMNECSPPDNWLSRRMRPRGAFCTNNEQGPDPQVNTNPSLAGLDSTQRILDPDNRRQCAYKFETLCCEGPVYPTYVVDCVRCKLPPPRCNACHFLFLSDSIAVP